ncbi:hypothetical protein FA10DRAFT_269745 [Acaromyces ingoldii]|uniref:ZN622/Rei1/Reh1 zinc finger C2H2-type domain-containing protein n=1 Tax=Acaromyces ingoldii TaxID=215250 RepID=A0A316YER2_9BASI|nr:hypothetical protein FA10DRAFT_269745 [Acaromyces ingoldii]PWN87138.1 hypothetical protein FA10DRAFT_269745 [Acaromyces ingoldii]
MNSRRHKETLSRVAGASTKAKAAPERSSDPLVVRLPATGQEPLESMSKVAEALPEEAGPSSSSSQPQGQTPPVRPDLTVSEDATEEEIQAAIDAKLATAKRIDPATACMFCLKSGFTALDESLEHMRKHHGFWLPEQDYLVDKPGLMTYLSDKICVGNICLYCNGRGRGFQTAEAVRKHMLDKSHCKVAYDFEDDKLELSDFYDFTSSYPDAGWEDVSDDGEELVDGDDDEAITEEDGDSDEETLPATDGGIRFGDNELELVLPSGARLGHRSLRRYYNQSLRPPDSAYSASSSTSGRQLAHRLNGGPRQKESTLVESRGGNAVYARDRGQAREAKRHIKEFRDVKRREQFKTQVAYRNNSQKHFRDPLLQ